MTDGNVYQIRKVYSHALMREVEELVVTGTVDVADDAAVEAKPAWSEPEPKTARPPKTGVVAKAKAKVTGKRNKRGGKKNT